MQYMILPMPKDGSITLGTISSTVGTWRAGFSHKNKMVQVLVCVWSTFLTVQGLLEPLYADHIFGEAEGFAFSLKAELPV